MAESGDENDPRREWYPREYFVIRDRKRLRAYKAKHKGHKLF